MLMEPPAKYAKFGLFDFLPFMAFAPSIAKQSLRRRHSHRRFGRNHLLPILFDSSADLGNNGRHFVHEQIFRTAVVTIHYAFALR